MLRMGKYHGLTDTFSISFDQGHSPLLMNASEAKDCAWLSIARTVIWMPQFSLEFLDQRSAINTCSAAISLLTEIHGLNPHPNVLCPDSTKFNQAYTSFPAGLQGKSSAISTTSASRKTCKSCSTHHCFKSNAPTAAPSSRTT